MNRETIAFRLDRDKKKALDAIAAGIDRDRSYVINEAIEAYLDIYRWQVEHIQTGLKQADAGHFVSDRTVRKAFSKWRK